MVLPAAGLYAYTAQGISRIGRYSNVIKVDLISNTEYQISNNEGKTSVLDIRNSVFYIIFHFCFS